MPGSLEIAVKRTGSLDDSPPEESATFGLLTVRVNDRLLTEAVSGERKGAPQSICEGPHVAGYSLAEWLIWNWWRLHWDEVVPPHQNIDVRNRWDFAHCMETAGDGYVWPKITIAPEGEQTRIVSEPSLVSDSDPFRYIASTAGEVVPTHCFTSAVDRFVQQVISNLERAGLRDTNLQKLLIDLKQERGDPEMTRFRRAEARLALDPDEAREEDIWRCLADARELGESSWAELAAEAAYSGVSAPEVTSAQNLRSLAESRGFVASRNNRIELSDLPRIKDVSAGDNGPGHFAIPAAPPGVVPPWVVGADLASRLRAHEDLDGRPLDDKHLGGFAGLSSDAITRTYRRGERLAYVLAEREGETRVVLRSGRRTGRRFELARLIGDRLLAAQNEYDDALFPATRAYTYRQKAQRAFAAELLSPFHALEDLMAGDYSADRQQKVAGHFRVSERTIGTQLVNYGRIPLEDAPGIV